MKASRIFVVSLVVVVIAFQAIPARAELTPNFVREFLKRYKPVPVNFAGAPLGSTPQELSDLIRAGQVPLTMGDLINLILQNNLDVSVNRLSPLSSQYLIDTLYRQFETSLSLLLNVNRNTTT